MGAISNLTRMLSTAFERRHQQSSSIPLTPANFAEQAQQPHRRQEPSLWSAVIDKITGQNKRFNTPAAAEQQSRWKMSGRKSLLNGRNAIKVGKRSKRNRGA